MSPYIVKIKKEEMGQGREEGNGIKRSRISRITDKRRRIKGRNRRERNEIVKRRRRR
jgi:hypothetical protein